MAPQMPRNVVSIWLAIAAVGTLLCTPMGTSIGQEMTPRAYWPAPRDTKILVVGYAYSQGDIVTDPSLPITGVDSRISSALVAYQQTLDLAGRTANLQLELPYTSGTTTGSILGRAGRAGRADVSGVGDVVATLSINLTGAPCMDQAEFVAMLRDPHPILAACLKIVAPTGKYDGNKLINIGSNRWAARLQVGYVYPASRRWWVGVWVFAENHNFLGTTLQQHPIYAAEGHLIRLTRSGIWATLDANYYAGGRSYVDHDPRPDFQRNSRMGLTLAYPFHRKHAIKVGYSRGIATESGGDYSTASLTYAVRLD
jgi:hypothetical protein